MLRIYVYDQKHFYLYCTHPRSKEDAKKEDNCTDFYAVIYPHKISLSLVKGIRAWMHSSRAQYRTRGHASITTTVSFAKNGFISTSLHVSSAPLSL